MIAYYADGRVIRWKVKIQSTGGCGIQIAAGKPGQHGAILGFRKKKDIFSPDFELYIRMVFQRIGPHTARGQLHVAVGLIIAHALNRLGGNHIRRFRIPGQGTSRQQQAGPNGEKKASHIIVSLPGYSHHPDGSKGNADLGS